MKRNNKSIFSQNLNESDDSDEREFELKKSKNSKTEKIKRKIYVQISDDENEDPGIFCLIQFVSNPERYDIVSEKQISFDPNDDSCDKVKHYSKSYAITILKIGD